MTSRQVMLNPPDDGADEAQEGERIDGEGTTQEQIEESRARAVPSGRGGDPGSLGERGAARSPPAMRSVGVRVASLAIRMVVGVLILAGAIAVAWVLVANRRQAMQAPLEETVRRVRAVEAMPRPADAVYRTWEGFGTARARDRADVAAEVGGRVVLRPAHIDPGVAVSAGEVLVRLDEADYRERMQAAQSAAVAASAQIESIDVEQERLREQVEQAREQVRLTQWEIDRLNEARVSAAGTELDTMRLRGQLSRLESERSRLEQQLEIMPSRRASLLAEVAALRNEAAVAERQMERTAVVSPIAGVIQEMDANLGEMLQPGQRVARVVDLNRLEIPLRLPASAQGEIRIGDTATVRTGAAGGVDERTWEARVARIAPEADPQTRTITVFLEVEQETPGAGGDSSDRGWSELLMPGRFVSADLAARAGNGGMLIVVPRRAVVDDRVWVASLDEAGVMRAQPRQVRVRYNIDAVFPELDASETQWAVIGAGVQEGDRVIVTNLDELVTGVRVDVVEADGSGR